MEYMIKQIESEQPLAIAFKIRLGIIMTYFVPFRAMPRLFSRLNSKALDISNQVRQFIMTIRMIRGCICGSHCVDGIQANPHTDLGKSHSAHECLGRNLQGSQDDVNR